ncbi:MAG: hypothetical protein A2X61_05795 [Ignavibacteria bacterium GWB2_35_12]|nr:MAG: hypothetical protein A2X63_00630 [Ignavibacteria bacterium GWA2_35_8]OGU42264.1 MAG: hypothetical protein A2X61_05795 [Ignavibacteria bacterium GWB2_35_12]OGU93529.1 MAG: hypothetical protein A2220_13065 [Ignavibacteria bacterium RIFOXYA2_FULL_35_10]OGV22161.1 MAG: hypothetical protein A2475_05630 [Ignavibacteria bacterium RIFOXYC2_FULL_35_21]
MCLFIDLSKPPRNKDINKWADYVELKTITHPDKAFSICELFDFPNDEDEFKSNNDVDLFDFEEPDKPTRDDKQEIFYKDCLNMLKYRAHLFKDFYPFEITNDGKVVTIKDSLIIKHKIYLFLLLASNLDDIKVSHWQYFTSSFEIISKEALKDFLPQNAEIHLFGSSNTEPLANEDTLFLKYSKKNDRIKELVKHIREKIQYPENEFSERDCGDAGLDLVAWIPNNDSLNSIPIYFVQCTCSPENKWKAKQLEISYDTWNEIISLKTYPQRFLFIPHNYRKLDGNWVKETTIRKSILIDRNRLIFHLKKNIDVFEMLSCYKLIGDLIKYKEQLFS